MCGAAMSSDPSRVSLESEEKGAEREAAARRPRPVSLALSHPVTAPHLQPCPKSRTRTTPGQVRSLSLSLSLMTPPSPTSPRCRRPLCRPRGDALLSARPRHLVAATQVVLPRLRWRTRVVGHRRRASCTPPGRSLVLSHLLTSSHASPPPPASVLPLRTHCSTRASACRSSTAHTSSGPSLTRTCAPLPRPGGSG